MPRQQRNQKSLPVIWRVSDDLWSMIEQVLAELDPPARTGRKRIDARSALDAIIFRLRSGCQWNRLPKEFPDDSSVHRTFQRWVRLGVFDRIWKVLLEACEDLGGATGSGRQPTPPWVRPSLGVIWLGLIQPTAPSQA